MTKSLFLYNWSRNYGARARKIIHPSKATCVRPFHRCDVLRWIRDEYFRVSQLYILLTDSYYATIAARPVFDAVAELTFLNAPFQPRLLLSPGGHPSSHLCLCRCNTFHSILFDFLRLSPKQSIFTSYISSAPSPVTASAIVHSIPIDFLCGFVQTRPHSRRIFPVQTVYADRRCTARLFSPRPSHQQGSKYESTWLYYASD